MTPEEWLKNKAKNFAKQQVLNVADRLSNKLQRASNRRESSTQSGGGRMGSIDGKDVPELLAFSALEVPKTSPDSEYILRGLPDFGKALLGLDATEYAFKEEPPSPELEPPPPVPPAPAPTKERTDYAPIVALAFVGILFIVFISTFFEKKPSTTAWQNAGEHPRILREFTVSRDGTVLEKSPQPGFVASQVGTPENKLLNSP